MKFKKKLIVGSALLAVVGGLAGCGKQSPKHHVSKAQQKTERVKMNRLKSATNSGKALQKVKGVKSDGVEFKAPFNPGQSGIATLTVHTGYPGQKHVLNKQQAGDRFKAFWTDYQKKAVKATHHRSIPVKFVFIQNDKKSGNHYYLADTANVNSPALHNQHMKSISEQSAKSS